MNRTLLLPLLLLAGCSVPSEKLSLTTPDHRERVYRLYVPPVLSPGPRPLVVVLHGGGGSGRQMERFLEFDALADKEGFLVAYPSGLDNGWNDGRETASVQSQADHIDDGAFVTAMLDEIARQHPVDPARVYATGISNGGFFAHYLANRFPAASRSLSRTISGKAPSPS
ncbi:MAG: hypothetical protein K8T20_02870 [Planctomycetes bacterium]|nr:hypothetical protein [Planctomycetota bacterium]